MSTFSTTLLSAALLLTLSVPPAVLAAQDGTAIYVDAQPLFSIPVGRGRLTAAQMTENIQHNLDNALIQASGQPSVAVSTTNALPSISLNGHFILDVDQSTARSLHTTPMALTNLWASKLRKALEAQLTNNIIPSDSGTISLAAIAQPEPAVAAAKPAMHFVRLPAGMILNVVLETDLHTAALRAGDEVSAVTTTDLKLPSGEVLSHGTRVFGDIISINTDSMFGPATVKMSFDRMQLVNGTQFPVAAGMVAGCTMVDSVLMAPGVDHVYPAGQPLQLELQAPAQLAVTGTML
ncbi:MAG TPA: hypothetical protein V6D22_04390 [Candidatus Obscuribacterales bacterium]